LQEISPLGLGCKSIPNFKKEIDAELVCKKKEGSAEDIATSVCEWEFAL
jgi:hypothetical protein